MINWSRAFGEPSLRGELRRTPEDFRVTEVASFEFSGDGEHDYLWIEKRGANSAWVARQLASHAGVPARDVGYAGLKDRHALTRQWFSVRRKPGSPADWAQLSLDGVAVLRAHRHRRKLRRGAHAGNEFRIKLHNIREIGDNLQEKLDSVSERGVPNYFAEQRFGRGAGNLQRALDLFDGRRLGRQSRSLALSAARAFLFNKVLQARVRDGSWNVIRAGDCASLDGSNSVFRVGTVDDALRTRCLEMDIHPSGPLWGRGEQMTSGEVARLERDIAAEEAVLARGLEKTSEQSRRPLRVRVRQFDWQMTRRSLTLRFRLPGGSYATAVLREIADYVDCGAAAPADEPRQLRSRST